MTPIDSIRARYQSAVPNPGSNPAWANCKRDCAVLLQEIDRLRGALERIACQAPGNPFGDYARKVLDGAPVPATTT